LAHPVLCDSIVVTISEIRMTITLVISVDRQLISIISAHFKEIPSFSSKDFKGKATHTETLQSDEMLFGIII
jgi:hypothetical protein